MKKESKISRVYKEFDTKYAGKTEEEINKEIENLEKEIKGKEQSLENSSENDQNENLAKDIEAKKQKLENLKGYSKYKGQIKGIKQYQTSLNAKLVKVVNEKENSLKDFKETKKELNEIVKKLNNPEETMKMTNEEYNALLQGKEDLSKKAQELSRTCKVLSEREQELKAKISKCDLAWKTLFTNKDWDEIQRRATDSKGRFTRKIDESQPPLGKKNKEKAEQMVEDELQNVGKEVSKMVDEKEETALVETKKQGFFKKLWTKIKTRVAGKNKDKKEEKEGKAPNVETKTERDEFIEGLRKHVDKEYSQKVKESKENEYIESHKKKEKTSEEKQKENDEQEIG